MPLAPEWQHPFVNIFKLCDVDTMREFETKGDVTEHIDKIIGKKVFKIRGMIPAGNYLRVPRTKLQTLGLTGRLLYIQLKVTPVKVFAIHIEVVTEDHNIHRISISNMYNPDSLKRKSNGVQLPFPKPSHRWCVLALDLREALRGYTSSPFASVKAVQMCSWMTVRTMFASDYKFNLQSLPGDMALSHALDSSMFEMVWLPAEPTDAPTMDFMPPPKRYGTRTRRPGTADADAGAAGGAGRRSVSSASVKSGGAGSAKGGKGAVATSGGGKRGVSSAGAKKSTRGTPSLRGSTASAATPGDGAGGGSGGDDDSEDDISEDHDNGTPPPPSPLVPPPLSPSVAARVAGRATTANIGAATAAGAIVGAAAAPSIPGESDASARPFPRPTTALLAGAATTAALRPPIASANLAKPEPGQPTPAPLVPDPALTLTRMNAYSGEFVRCLAWLPGGDEVAYAAASVVVIMAVGDPAAVQAPPGQQAPLAPGRQRYCLGHTAFVCALAVASDGRTLASCQEGKEAIVRLWDTTNCACLAILNAHASGLSCVDISPDLRALAAVGLDGQSRQTIALWNIAELRAAGGPKAELVTRHATEYNIKVLRFSAYQEDHLLTAGRDSIRIYRLKAGQLRGTSVRLVPQDKRVTSFAGGVSAAVGPNIFTDIGFEAGVGVYGVDAFKVYVSSASGALFVVDYTTRQLDAIFQLHAAAINCLVVSDGLVLTGGDDRLLRAWPLDFRDYLLEAEHEGAVTGLAISPDALRLAVGTENGTLGVLAIPSHAYTTLLRSHCGAVNAVAVDPNRDQYCTVSSDGTLRIWHLATHQQLYEFDAPGEAVSAIAYHPHPSHHELAAGFANGRLRVFDVPSTTLLQEHHQHRAGICELLFSPGGDRLFSGGADGALVVYDTARMYAPAQYLSAGVRDIKVCCAVSCNGAFFASLVRDPYRRVTSLLVFHGRTLDPFMRIETDAAAYVKLAFSADCNELWALTSTRRLDRYELKDGQLVQQIHEVSPLDMTALCMDPAGRYAATAGVDGLLRLWGCVPLAALRGLKGLPPNSAFLGHPSAILGAAFHRSGYLITVGDADCVCVWRVNADHMQRERGALAATAHALRGAAADGAAAGSSAATSPLLLQGAHTYAGALDPTDPRSRAHPSTALGPVASARDHQLTTRAAALGTPLPAGVALVPAPAAFTGTASLGAMASPTHISAATANSLAALSLATNSPAVAATAPGLPSQALVVPKPTPPPAQPAPSSPGRSPTRALGPALARARLPVPLPPSPHPLPPPPPPRCSWLLGYSPTGCSNVAWNAVTGLFCYVVEDMVVMEKLATRQQRYLRGHNRPLACLASSSDGGLVAAGPAAAEPAFTEPAAGRLAQQQGVAVGPAGASPTAPFADVVVWEAASGREVWRLRYHPLGVQALAFSPDGRWLVSLGRNPERSVVVWDVAAGLLVAAGRTEQSPLTAAWLWGGHNPAFATAGADGLLLWTLQDNFLEQRSVPLSPTPSPRDPRPVTALAVDAQGALLAAEAPAAPGAQVPVWQVQVELQPPVVLQPQEPGGEAAVAGGGVSAAVVQVAALPSGCVVTAMAAGLDFALLATDTGSVVRYRRSTLSGTWLEASAVRLDGRVAALAAEPNMCDAVAATDTATIWFVGMQDASCVPIVCGQAAPVTGLVPAPHSGRVMASTSADGLLRVWRLGPEDAEPAIELHSTSPATAAAFLLRQPTDAPAHTLRNPPSAPASDAASDAAASLDPLGAAASLRVLPVPHLLGGYGDGSLRLFALEPAVQLSWALARHPAPVVGVAPHPKRGLILSASSDGSLAVTDLATTRLLSYITAFTAAGPTPLSPSGTGKRSPRGAASPPPAPPRPGTGPLQAMAVSSGPGAPLAALAWRDRLVVFAAPWDDPTCSPLAEYDVAPSDGRTDAADSHGLLSPDVPACLAFINTTSSSGSSSGNPTLSAHLGGSSDAPSSKLLAYSSPLLPGTVLLYDVRLAAVARRVRLPQMVRSLAVAPGGGAMVVGCMGRSVFLVHLASGNTEELGGHAGPVAAAAYTGDGGHAVTASGSVLMVWDAGALLKGVTPPPPPRMLREF
ncbi:hypothetical protein HYH02_007576 [Chlamydomonas schloesseri]|uniref:CFA20 domain-containing protein n=1 Tax=Chlamydomonas schloesseri TaxID=2026947 RepID=A0A835WIN3_9CHLO|nr:hypothetical protein HYH02_007576 [Chlamydomonas schloesseri]|eukprot:KAG2447660.1 hypothetical protein HYH02_007576 [Chlamydomonas schloesseri]